MSYRKHNHEKPIVAQVMEEKASSWSEETHKVALTDTQRILEALVADLGVNECVNAMDRQGFKGSAYTYLLNPLFIEAGRRRSLYLVEGDEQNHG